jgi:P pilus assembly chaperone PapD
MRLPPDATSSFIAILVLLLLFAAMPGAASVPSVIITDYEVSPAVLLPGEQGIISVTVRNTADSATLTQSFLSDTTDQPAEPRNARTGHPGLRSPCAGAQDHPERRS